jgi:hypothetical protein
MTQYWGLDEPFGEDAAERLYSRGIAVEPGIRIAPNMFLEDI